MVKMAKILYRTELSDNTQVTLFEEDIVEIRQGRGQSVHFRWGVDTLTELIDALTTIRDEDY